MDNYTYIFDRIVQNYLESGNVRDLEVFHFHVEPRHQPPESCVAFSQDYSGSYLR